jgi:hypothetical protein
MESVMNRRAVMGVICAGALLAGCGDDSGGSATTGTTGTTTTSSTGSSVPRALRVNVALTDDGQGIPLFTQNGSMVHVPAADVAGKPFFWATTPGGEPVGNAELIDIGGGTIDPDLTAEFTTPEHYPDGPWEMALFISVVGGDVMMGPQPDDLAAFDLDPPPAGDPPVTGISVRMKVSGADAEVTLVNRYFIRF